MTPEERSLLIAKDKQNVWHPYTEMSAYRRGTPLVIERAHGARLVDANGREYIDGNAQWWTSLLGHNHPRLVRALCSQAEKLCHTSLAGITHAPAVELSEALIRTCPDGLKHAFFSDNGSTAVEAAIKMAIQFWTQQPTPRHNKSRFLALEGAFHGETLGATALCDVGAFRSPFSQVTMPVTHLPSPAVDLDLAVSALKAELAAHADTICALVIEPLIQGAGGMQMYSPEYLVHARQLTEKYGVLLIVDEVFTGYGRTGTFWACEQAQITPDILCSAKGLSGGMLPFAATIASEQLFEAFMGDRSRAFLYGHTYCGNPLGAAVACEVLRVYEDEDVLAGAVIRAKLIKQSMARLAELPGVYAARSLGVCGALNLGEGGGYLSDLGWRVYEAALAQGVYLRPLGNVVYLTPALNIPLPDLELLLRAVETSVQGVLDELKSVHG